MKQAQALIVAYDISDHRKRRRLFKHLSGYGSPLQESVFYCPSSSAEQHRRLSRELKDLPLEGGERLHCFLVNAQQSAILSPSPICQPSWIVE